MALDEENRAFRRLDIIDSFAMRETIVPAGRSGKVGA
jgi:hypothetical protein